MTIPTKLEPGHLTPFQQSLILQLLARSLPTPARILAEAYPAQAPYEGPRDPNRRGDCPTCKQDDGRHLEDCPRPAIAAAAALELEGKTLEGLAILEKIPAIAALLALNLLQREVWARTAPAWTWGLELTLAGVAIGRILYNELNPETGAA